MKITRYIWIGCLSLFGLTACDELNLAPEDYYASGNYWKNASQAKAGVTYLHAALRSTYNNLFYMGELRGGTFFVGASMVGTSLDQQAPIQNQVSEDLPGPLGNWAGLYSNLFGVNNAINMIENECAFLTDSERHRLLGQAYGIRAFYYFYLYRTYGGVPKVTETLVLEGHTSAESLYTPRSAASEILALVKDDVKKSEDYLADFGYGDFQNVEWGKGATQMLKAQVYLWSAKVATGDHAAGGQADLQVAKSALQNIIGQYELVKNYADVFAANNKRNPEIIFAFHFAEGESTNGNLYSRFVSEVTYFNDRFYGRNGKLMGDTLLLNLGGGGLLRYVYKWGLYASMDERDARANATFLDCYNKDEATGDLTPAGLIYRKTLGSINSEDTRVYDCNYIIYRYADALLMMAEVENGLNAASTDVAKYINEVRKRAYGDGYVEATDAYTVGSFADNELAILHERDKEFVLEGCRWFDVVRLRGADGKSICFSKTSGYVDMDPTAEAKPVLEAGEEYKLLWPISTGLLNGDPTLTQTPGYDTKYGDR